MGDVNHSMIGRAHGLSLPHLPPGLCEVIIGSAIDELKGSNSHMSITKTGLSHLGKQEASSILGFIYTLN